MNGTLSHNKAANGALALSEITEPELENYISSESKGGGWSASHHKRLFDFWVAFCALILFSPVMILTAIAVKLSSRGPALFQQDRMGKAGKTFTIYKFRTMHASAPVSGPSVTRAGDARMTRVGRILRSTKLDELPQLVNVLRGDMSLVGPRPKLPQHQTYELTVLPGITGAASLAFRNEEAVIQGIPEDQLEEYQLHIMMPVKKALDEQYARVATFYSDLALLAKTALGKGELMDLEGIYSFRHSLASLGRAIENMGHTALRSKPVYDAHGRQNRTQAVQGNIG